MMVTTKGRYALRVMLDLAKQPRDSFVTLQDIATRQDISEKYLESIVSSFAKAGYLISLRGKGGGYKLARKPEDYTVLSILELVEGSIAPVACVETNPVQCEKADECPTYPLWKGLDKVISDYLRSQTLADLL